MTPSTEANTAETVTITLPWTVVRTMVEVADDFSYDVDDLGLNEQMQTALTGMGNQVAAAFADDTDAIADLFGIASLGDPAIEFSVERDVVRAYLIAIDRFATHRAVDVGTYGHVFETILEEAASELDLEAFATECETFDERVVDVMSD